MKQNVIRLRIEGSLTWTIYRSGLTFEQQPYIYHVFKIDETEQLSIFKNGNVFVYHLIYHN